MAWRAASLLLPLVVWRQRNAIRASTKFFRFCHRLRKRFQTSHIWSLAMDRIARDWNKKRGNLAWRNGSYLLDAFLKKRSPIIIDWRMRTLCQVPGKGLVLSFWRHSP